MTEDSYDSICCRINEEWKKIRKPTQNDLREISKKFKVDVPVVRECVGLADCYNFVLDD